MTTRVVVPVSPARIAALDLPLTTECSPVGHNLNEAIV